jgi:hypothetical protein
LTRSGSKSADLFFNIIVKEFFMSRILSVAVFLLTLTAGAGAGTARLDWMEEAYSDGRHNAFTDLAYWEGQYYLCFRNGRSHGSMDGEIRVMRSPDMRAWEKCTVLHTAGDDRDPHFTVAGDRLYVFFGVWDLQHSGGYTPTGRGSIRSHMAYTQNGVKWVDIRAIYEPRWWVWRVRYDGDRFYGAAYTAYRPAPPERETRLLVSRHGLNWDLHATIATERGPSESDMLFHEDGSMTVITRMTDKTNESFLYRSGPEKKNWEGHNLGEIIHSPAVARWHDRVFVAGRGKENGKWVTKFHEVIDRAAAPLLTLPSGGDTSYPGLIVDPASLETETPAFFISWYSQHEKLAAQPGCDPAAVYTGRIEVE